MTHFERWSNAYQEYIDEWYQKFTNLFTDEPIPTRKDFYFYCYINTRTYYDPSLNGSFPPIVLTPRKEMLLNEDQYDKQK